MTSYPLWKTRKAANDKAAPLAPYKVATPLTLISLSKPVEAEPLGLVDQALVGIAGESLAPWYDWNRPAVPAGLAANKAIADANATYFETLHQVTTARRDDRATRSFEALPDMSGEGRNSWLTETPDHPDLVRAKLTWQGRHKSRRKLSRLDVLQERLGIA